MQIKRRRTRTVRIGDVSIGMRYPVLIQSMTKTKTSNIEETLRQIEEIKQQGCSTIRVAIKDDDDARAIKEIKRNTSVNLIADIHFHYRLALRALENGVDKVRLNPANIYRRDEIKQIVREAKLRGVPIRVGVNSGSVVKTGRDRSVSAAMVKAALKYIRLLNSFGFDDIVVSLKASSVMETLAAYRKISSLCDYPLHLGITASGLPQEGVIKSVLGIGVLLLEGIGDTIRVSLTASPKEEVIVSHNILQTLGLEERLNEIVSCPTCGRCSVNLERIVREVQENLKKIAIRSKDRYKKIAIMGCEVNGPGEAKTADIGVAFGKRYAVLFEKGRLVKRVSGENCIEELLRRIRK